MMNKKEILIDIENKLKSNDYNIEQLLEILPEELLDDLKEIIKENIYKENKKLNLEKNK